MSSPAASGCGQRVERVRVLAEHGAEVGAEQELDVAADAAEVLGADAQRGRTRLRGPSAPDDEPAPPPSWRVPVYPVVDARPGAVVVDGEVGELGVEPDVDAGPAHRVEQDRLEAGPAAQQAGNAGLTARASRGSGRPMRALGEVGVGEGRRRTPPGR